MELFEGDPRPFYDQVDMRDSYRAGFWIGTVAGIGSAIILCCLLGLYLA